ncbi:MAG: sulfate adenylyltransferase subunit CysN [Bdellovibrionota bacterium]|nr:MAG: sulfate adenylyltransferase subunit CysN [Bdellovibrionota bacterium]
MHDLTSRQDEQTLLRFSTAGSVDDGKSTLVGRLLYDSKNLFDDHVDAIERASKKTGDGSFSLALVTDGLRAEREQGITIDVAYRYFSTPRRRFILADTPGHEQYTRNMATGASTADVAVILVDAEKGVVVQTKRHSFISSLLGVPRILVAVNKMDLVGYSEEVFDRIRKEYLDFATRLAVRDIRFVPVSALKGDNVVERSGEMTWYHGETVLEYLENVYIASDRNQVDFRFPIQLVIRKDGTYRGYAGQISSGSIRVGEEVLVLPSMRRSTIRSIEQYPGGALAQASAPQSVVLTLSDEIDISRGDMIVRVNNVPHIQSHCEAMMVWMNEAGMDPQKQYLVLHTARSCKARIETLRYRVDVNTLSREEAKPLQLNEIGRVALTFSKPLFLDSYQRNRNTGNFILIDPDSYQTVAAGIVLDALPEELVLSKPQPGNLHHERSTVPLVAREARNGHKACTVWCTGLPSSGKSTIARELERKLFEAGLQVYHLDGDNLRMGLNTDLGFSSKDRSENLRRAAHVARLLNDAGVSVVCAFVSPYAKDREAAREIIGRDRFVEVHVATPLSVCEERDPHGLYRKARAGEVKDFTGVSAPYEDPVQPHIKVSTSQHTAEECVVLVITELERLGFAKSATRS